MKIALVGYARSGKDTVGEMMQDYLELNGHGHTVLMGFGDALKDRFHDAFPDVPEDPKPREGYERFGQLGRDLDNYIWIKALEKDMNLCELSYSNVIVTDLRQPNEEKWARENGFIFVGVWAYPNDREKRSSNDSTFEIVNKSEEKLHEINLDYTIYNIDSLDFLKTQVINVIEEVLESEKTTVN